MSLDTPTRETRTEPVRRQGKVAALITAGVVAAGLIAGGGYALGHLGNDTTTSQSQFGGGPGGNGGGGFPGGGQNGMGQPPAAGTVSAVTGTTITVTVNGTATTYAVTSDTQIMNDGATAQLSDLAVGDEVVVMAGTDSSGGTATARRIMAGTSATSMQQGGPAGQQGQQGQPGQPGGTPPSVAPSAGSDT